MLFYLLSSDELRELFDRLGYRFAPEADPENHRVLPVAHVTRIHPERRSAFVVWPRLPGPSNERVSGKYSYRTSQTSREALPPRAFTWLRGGQVDLLPEVFHRLGISRGSHSTRSVVA